MFELLLVESITKMYKYISSVENPMAQEAVTQLWREEQQQEQENGCK